VLQDGRLIKVERNVEWTTHIEFLDPFFGLPTIPRVSKSWPDKFGLKFQHPDTKAMISWQGEQHFNPVLLDIISGIPYLVVYGDSTKTTERKYGCPELPFIYLKYDAGQWSPVALEAAPKALRKANLSPKYPDFGSSSGDQYEIVTRKGRSRRDMSIDDVAKSYLSVAPPVGRMAESPFQREIPRSYEEWNYNYRNGRRDNRQGGDCRPPRTPLPQVVLPGAIGGSPEILETINYTPDRIAIGDDWSNMAFDQKREGECKKVFRPTDPNDYMQGQRFVNDSTGKKPAPYSSGAQFKMGVRVLCDEYVWFVTHMEEPGKIIISKFTTTGDMVLRTSFRNPERVQGFTGYINIPSLRSEGGYLYFDWMDFTDINREWHIKRILKMRMKEPVPTNVGNGK